jgi:hypothetical protein
MKLITLILGYYLKSIFRKNLEVIYTLSGIDEKTPLTNNP